IAPLAFLSRRRVASAGIAPRPAPLLVNAIIGGGRGTPEMESKVPPMEGGSPFRWTVAASAAREGLRISLANPSLAARRSGAEPRARPPAGVQPAKRAR